MSEINEGVRILVERMKTNPEEFYEGYESKWSRVIQRAQVAGWLTADEHKLMGDAANKLQRERFTADVLKTLTQADQYASEAESKKMYVNPAQLAIAKKLAGGPTTITTNNTGAIAGSTLMSNGSPVATQADIDRAVAKLQAWGDEK